MNWDVSDSRTMSWVSLVLLVLRSEVTARILPVENLIPVQERLALCVTSIMNGLPNVGSRIIVYSDGSSDLIGSFTDLSIYLRNPWIVKSSKNFKRHQNKGAVMIIGPHDDYMAIYMLPELKPSGMLVIISLRRIKNLRSIFKVVADANRARTVLLMPNENNTVELYSYTMNAYRQCGIVTVIKMGDCSSKTLHYDISKISNNFNGCPVKLSTAMWMPYWTLEIHNGTKVDTGMFRHLFAWIVQRLNATAQYSAVNEIADINSVVQNGEADIGYGSIVTYPDAPAIFSKPYMYSSPLIILPAMKLNLSLLYVTALTLKDWLMMTGMVSIIILMGTLSNIFDKKFPLLQTIPSFLGNSAVIRVTSLTQRLYMICWIFLGFAATRVYLVNLTMLMSPSTNYGSRKFRTIEQFESSYTGKIVGTPHLKQQFHECCPHLFQNYENVTIADFQFALANLTSGISTLPMVASYTLVLNTKFQFRHVTYIPEEVSLQPIVIAVPMYSTLMSTINWIINGVNQGGFSALWLTRMQYKSSKSWHKVGSIDDQTFSMQHIQGALVILGTGLTFSMLAFLGELLINSYLVKWKQVFRRLSRCRRLRETSSS
ncbi:uncharacterized protein LOC107274241 isoform X2 [Cephus cinctus]|uniref:Uncharacterized protein LOC107274241 isoform X2 n=1 Tax=Cephus cinctus TaxID=211228 RepID=A0AAJ7W7D9_CEPCN|nr:uncharacterized protein LOC107274241 isoform X2 [Cephus cinctus]